MKKLCPACDGTGVQYTSGGDIKCEPDFPCDKCGGYRYELSNELCLRCDYGPKYGHSDECRGNYDPDEPCRNAEPEEYENE